MIGYGDAYDDSWDEKPTEEQLAEQAANDYEYQCGLRDDKEYYAQYG